MFFLPFLLPLHSIFLSNTNTPYLQCLANNILVTRLKGGPITHHMGLKDNVYTATPALKVCVTSGLSKKETEKAGIAIRHAITKVMTKKGNNKLGVPTA